MRIDGGGDPSDGRQLDLLKRQPWKGSRGARFKFRPRWPKSEVSLSWASKLPGYRRFSQRPGVPKSQWAALLHEPHLCELWLSGSVASGLQGSAPEEDAESVAASPRSSAVKAPRAPGGLLGSSPNESSQTGRLFRLKSTMAPEPDLSCCSCSAESPCPIRPKAAKPANPMVFHRVSSAAGLHSPLIRKVGSATGRVAVPSAFRKCRVQSAFLCA